MYEIKKMKPIKLTQYGETLLEYPRSSYTTCVKPKDPEERQLNTCVGIHGVCNGWMDIREVSSTHKAITCRACGLRVVFPESIKTFGALRKFCETVLILPG